MYSRESSGLAAASWLSISALLSSITAGLAAGPPSAQSERTTPRQTIPFYGAYRWAYNPTPVVALGSRPDGAIRCIGSAPSTEEWFHGSLISYNSITSFCAEPQYGGLVKDFRGNPSYEGGFCATFFSGKERFVMARPTPDHGTEFKPAWGRWYFCQTKCSCADPNYRTYAVERAAYEENLELTEYEGEAPWVMLRMGHDLGKTVTKTMEESPEIPYLHPIPVLPLPEANIARDMEPDRLKSLTRKTTIQGKQGNQMICDGPLPAWPYQNGRQYTSLLKICAANIIDGDGIANMGGLCTNPHHNKIEFLDILAHPDYSASICSYRPDSLACSIRSMLQVYCKSRCYCSTPSRSNFRHGITQKVKGYGHVKLLEDNYYLELTKTKKSWMGLRSQQKTTRYAPSDKFKDNINPNSRSDLGLSKCLSASEVSVPGCEDYEIPPLTDASHLTYDDILEIKEWNETSRLDLDGEDAKTCGTTCTGPADCGGGSGGSRGCRCRVDRSSPHLSETYDPIIGRVVKYTFAASCYLAAANSGLGPAGAMGGRKRGLELDGMACACNATYVSEGCCESEDGLVWEGGKAKLGELR
ncbi:MAG: hypothetical protein M1814_000992 [Vezdaea aestivalis]|nr:MAG: hypothetical protein M1814_000992 [Vezdaea aestivalis]